MTPERGSTNTLGKRVTWTVASVLAASLPLGSLGLLGLRPAAGATTTWQAGASFANALTSVAQGELGTVGSDGRVYFVGGGWQGLAVSTLCSSGRNFYAVAAYDPHSTRWSFVAPLQTPRNRAVVVTGSDGQVYAIAGQQPLTPCSPAVNALNAVEAYSPASNSWSPVAPMVVARQSAGATEGTDGRIYVFGGRDGAGAVLGDSEVYDPTTNRWTQIAPMPEPRAQSAVAADRLGRIYVFGGDNGAGGTSTVERYTPATNSWDSGVLADPAGATLGGTAVRGPDGRMYLIGMGFQSSIPPWAGTNIMIYDPLKNGWTNTPQLSFAPGGASPSGWMAGVAADGTIYAAGPANIGGTFQDTAQSLAPSVQVSSTAISAPTVPSVYGQTVSLSATVSGTDGGGSVTFTDGGAPIPGCQSVALVAAGLEFQALCSTPALGGGSHSISAGYSGDSLSTASSSGPAAAVVSPAPLVVTASSATMAYGATPPPVTPLVAGLQAGDTVAALSGLNCSTPATPSAPVGSYPTSCAGLSNPNYTVSYQSGTTTVTPVALTVVASSASVSYGQPVPSIAPVFSGFVNGDGPGSLATSPVCGTAATTSSPVGSYPTSCTGAVDPNYVVTYVPGSLNIDPAPLMISAPSGTMTYGGTVPDLTPTYAGFVNGEGPASMGAAAACVTSATAASPVGSYPSSCAGAADPNYSISYTPGQVVIGPSPLVVSASSASVIYGDVVPPITPFFAGFVNGDSPASMTIQPACSTSATARSAVGSFPSSCNGASDPNYSITYVNGSVDIKPAPLSVTASSGSMTYGSTVPVITAAYAGFVNGEDASALTDQPACAASANKSTPVGTYATTCTGARASNYSINYVPGTVAVLPASLAVTADSQTMQSGSAVPPLTATMSGFVNGETMSTSDVRGQANCTTTATTSSQPGTYPISCSAGTLVSSNYRFTFGAGVLTITPSAGVACVFRGRVDVGPHQQLRLGPGCSVNGRIVVHGGGSLDLSGATIRGSIAFNGSGTLMICATRLRGELTVSEATGTIDVGDSGGCKGDWLDGEASFRSNRAVVNLHGAQVHGDIEIERNSSGITVTDNVVRGRLIVRANAAPVVVAGNRVTNGER